MDRHCPEDYIEASPMQSIDDTRALIAHIRSLERQRGAGGTLVEPILTPRFAISCSDTLLESLGMLAKDDESLRVQTHISENRNEIAFTKDLFPKAKNYTDVYDKFGLLRSNTILAHGIYLEQDEIQTIAGRGAGISHCPTSNFNLSSGVAPIGMYLDAGIKVWSTSTFRSRFT
jgi:guanine deaminase